MRKYVPAAIAAVLVLAVLSVSAGAVDYRVTVFQTSASAHSINNFNQVAGWYITDPAIFNLNTGSRVITTAAGDYGCSINDSGQVVCTSSNMTNYISCRWDGVRQPQPISSTGLSSCVAQAINNLSQVAGNAQAPGEYRHACLWDANDQITLIDTEARASYAYGLNDLGAAAGCYYVNHGYEVRAFVWDKTTGMRTLPAISGWSASAQDVNNSGLVVGASSDGTRQCATLWDMAGNPLNLGVLDGLRSYAEAINDAGTVVGMIDITQTGSVYDPFIWDQASGTRKLPKPQGYSQCCAFDINDNGWIVGSAQGYINGRFHSDAVVWTPVPEPASATCLVSLIAGLGMLLVRRKT